MGGSIATTGRQRATLAAFELGVEFELKMVHLLKQEHKLPKNLARQPFGQVPILVDHSREGWILGVHSVRVSCDRSLPERLSLGSPRPLHCGGSWSAGAMDVDGAEPPHTGLFQRVVGPLFGAKTDEEAARKKAAEAQIPFAVMEAHLAQHPYLAGADFSLAEVCNMPLFGRLAGTEEGKQLFRRYPNVAS
jgi:glutathione S-transferase